MSSVLAAPRAEGQDGAAPLGVVSWPAFCALDRPYRRLGRIELLDGERHALGTHREGTRPIGLTRGYIPATRIAGLRVAKGTSGVAL